MKIILDDFWREGHILLGISIMTSEIILNWI